MERQGRQGSLSEEIGEIGSPSETGETGMNPKVKETEYGNSSGKETDSRTGVRACGAQHRGLPAQAPFSLLHKQ